jgi:integrase
MVCPVADTDTSGTLGESTGAMKLTTTTIRSIALPPGKTDKTFFDDDLPGFGVRLRAGGSRTWVIQYKIGNKHRRIPLGSVSALDPGKARATAKDLLAAVRLGRDPAGEKIEARVKAAETLDSLLPRFLVRQRARLKPRTYREVERHLLVQAEPLHGRAIDTIDRRAVAIRLAEIAESSGPVAANRARASLSTCFAWLVREGIIEANPVVNTNKALERGARERVLDDGEIREIWGALGDDHYGAIVKLLTLTGQRRDEIASLRWSEVDLDRTLISLPGERTKNRRPHEIPLGTAALDILAAQPRRLRSDGSPRDLVFGYGESGFQDWSSSKRDLDARILAARKAKDPDAMPITPWRLHDLRRTTSTVMHDKLGVPPHVVEAVLNHVSGHKAGIAGVYNRAPYAGEKILALLRWAEHVLAVVEGRESRVVPLLRTLKT